MFVKTIFFHGSTDLVGRPVPPYWLVSANSLKTYRHSVGLWTRDQPNAKISDNTQTLRRDRHLCPPAKFETVVPASERAAADPRPGLRGHWDRLETVDSWIKTCHKGKDLTEATVKNTDLWDVTTYSLVFTRLHDVTSHIFLPLNGLQLLTFTRIA